MKSLFRIIAFINNHPLARKNKALAFSRLIRWQLLSTFRKGFIQMPFIGNLVFMVKKGMHGLTGNIYTGLHEFEDMAFLLHYLRKNDLFVDIGANAGAYTLLAAGRCNCRSVAFEPSPDTVSILCSNVKLNHLESLVTIENLGAGSENKTIMFSTGKDTMNHVIYPEDPDQTGVAVTICRLDDYLKGKTPSLIKIDTEGFETEVIKGALHTLRQPALQAIIIELNGSGMRYGYDDNLVHQQLKESGFLPYRYDAFKRILTESDHFGTQNTLYIRNIAAVSMRVKEAPYFEALNIRI